MSRDGVDYRLRTVEVFENLHNGQIAYKKSGNRFKSRSMMMKFVIGVDGVAWTSKRFTES